jgi:hypothetical protein
MQDEESVKFSFTDKRLIRLPKSRSHLSDMHSSVERIFHLPDFYRDYPASRLNVTGWHTVYCSGCHSYRISVTVLVSYRPEDFGACTCWYFLLQEISKLHSNAIITNKQTNSLALSQQANYTDWAKATFRRNLVPTVVERGMSSGQRGGCLTVVNLSFLDRSRYFSFKNLLIYLHKGWVDPVPDPLLLRKCGRAGNRTGTSGLAARNSDYYTKIHAVVFGPNTRTSVASGADIEQQSVIIVCLKHVWGHVRPYGRDPLDLNELSRVKILVHIICMERVGILIVSATSGRNAQCNWPCWMSLKTMLFSSWPSMDTRSIQYSRQTFLASSQSSREFRYWGWFPLKK